MHVVTGDRGVQGDAQGCRNGEGMNFGRLAVELCRAASTD